MTDTTLVTSSPSSNLTTGIIRTVTPVLVGALLTLLVHAGLHLNSDVLTPVVDAGLTSAYYVGVRTLEHFKSSKWGWLLGKPSAPIYPTGTQTTIAP